MIQSGRNVAHKAHEEERKLQDRIREEVHAIHEFIVPRYGVEIDEDRGRP